MTLVLCRLDQPRFHAFPEDVKASMVAKTHPVPRHWPPLAAERVARLHPRYSGTASPTPRELYFRAGCEPRPPMVPVPPAAAKQRATARRNGRVAPSPSAAGGAAAGGGGGRRAAGEASGGARPVRVACCGEHTTHSAHPQFKPEYPGRLQRLLGPGYEVSDGSCPPGWPADLVSQQSGSKPLLHSCPCACPHA